MKTFEMINEIHTNWVNIMQKLNFQLKLVKHIEQTKLTRTKKCVLATSSALKFYYIFLHKLM